MSRIIKIKYRIKDKIEFLKKDLVKYRYLYIMALPVIAWYAIFHYMPMYGVQIAFRDFNPGLGIVGSPWIGLRHFKMFFSGIYFWRILRNTLLISFYSLFFGFPAPIILALLLNEIENRRFKRIVQTVSYLPHFISMVVICGIIREFTASEGFINTIIEVFGGERRTMLLDAKLFRTIYISSDIWQNVGWGSIIYLASLSSIDQTHYDAAVIDGAGRFRSMLHVTLPGIAPTIIILLILRMGNIMSVGYEKIILLYNSNIYSTADVISTFVYRKGLLEMSYSYSSAVGLFNNVTNLALVITANKISRKVTETSLW
jgi:putative aldouronate transport system permease protein